MRPGTYHAPGLGEPYLGESKKILRKWAKQLNTNTKGKKAAK